MLQIKIIPVTPFQQNCSLMWCTDTMEGAVVDPGGDLDIILSEIEATGITITKILITHGHIDHAGATNELHKKLEVPIIGPHKGDLFWIEGLEEQGKEYNFTWAQVFEPTQWLKHGDKVSVGNIDFDVIHCPGHTPGHVVFYNKDQKVAIVGDVLFQGSIGRTDFPQGNHADLINAITTRLWPLGNDVTFLPGHGPTSTFGIERQSNPFVGDKALAQGKTKQSFKYS